MAMTADEPRLLLLETSGRVGQVALAQGDTLRRSRRLDETRRHAADLVPAVTELLAAQGWQPHDIQAVIISRGPGSYTGLRVGIMSAKAFAYATRCDLIAVDTFAAVALQAPPEMIRFDVIGDAQQGKLYVQRFIRGETDTDPQAESALHIQSVDGWLAARDRDVGVTGPGLHIYQSRLPPEGTVANPELWDPRPESLLRNGLELYRKGKRSDCFTLEPLYLRPSSAEEKWQARSKA
jgi:tRNA threonylcarbamoyladenosine biosynthesis protein TsaB